MAATSQVTIGEERITSAGNVFRLLAIDGEWRTVQRVKAGERFGEQLWDADMKYRWHSCQWEEQLPLVGADTSEYPWFGSFIP